MRETIKNEFFLSENNWIKDFLKKIIDFYLQVFSLFYRETSSECFP